MKLEGRAKEDFEKWLISNEINQEILSIENMNYYGAFDLFDLFEKLPFSCQYGVLVDWFDSVGINVQITQEFDNSSKYQRGFNVEVDFEELFNNNDCFETRPEARTQAILKGMEIYNERNK